MFTLDIPNFKKKLKNKVTILLFKCSYFNKILIVCVKPEKNIHMFYTFR